MIWRYVFIGNDVMCYNVLWYIMLYWVAVMLYHVISCCTTLDHTQTPHNNNNDNNDDDSINNISYNNIVIIISNIILWLWLSSLLLKLFELRTGFLRASRFCLGKCDSLVVGGYHACAGHIHIYIYIYTYIHTYIHTHIHILCIHIYIYTYYG